MNVQKAHSADDIAAVQELWREYWSSFALPTEFQGFGEELEGLPGVYGSAGGALLLACENGEAAGTIALRRLDSGAGEVKRLYVRPKFRGQGLARGLLERVIERAFLLKYESLFADTLPSMREALALYRRLGFEEVESYSVSPTPGAIYLKLNLGRARMM